MTNIQERGTAAPIAFPINASQGRFSGIAPGASAARTSGDLIRRVPPGYAPPCGDPSGWSAMISQLIGIIQGLLSMLGMGNLFDSGSYFQSANAASVGDPHLSFNGTDANGGNVQTRFDNMAGHTDLLSSDSFAGGYRISTSVTQPGTGGVTDNQRAVVSTDFGRTQVSLDKDGDATVLEDGRTSSLADGQSVNLGGGESATRASGGSVVIRDDNGIGGTIAATLSENGQGVDVNAQASGVDLAGDVLGAVGA